MDMARQFEIAKFIQTPNHMTLVEILLPVVFVLHTSLPQRACTTLSYVLNIDANLPFSGQKPLRHASLQKHWVRQLKESSRKP